MALPLFFSPLSRFARTTIGAFAVFRTSDSEALNVPWIAAFTVETVMTSDAKDYAEKVRKNDF